jgi:hypothetical protein
VRLPSPRRHGPQALEAKLQEVNSAHARGRGHTTSTARIWVQDVSVQIRPPRPEQATRVNGRLRADVASDSTNLL